MNQKFTFVFILLVALSVTNAIFLKKRDYPCPIIPSFNATVSPDPPVPKKNATINVSGTLEQDIKENGMLIIGFKYEDCVPLGVYSTTPVNQTKAGNPFNITVNVTVPPNFASENSIPYYIWAYIENGYEPIGCDIVYSVNL
ncbi:15392_t:CDS:1 [Dentiscutata heterogama]|uniref:15392_t:CDS:1 n=1 Tax=Dentiscutata heterogama TaxID=1316150 RepID=A0ACA9JZ33_9GLOM|nr:15392_t:CDS:1 [Dentiscutata heterogama]